MSPQRDLVFLDASVLVAASRSPTGGSALVMEVCQGNRFRAALRGAILLEAKINISEKFGEAELLRFYRFIAALDPVIGGQPSPGRLGACVPIVGEKDAHVLAAALDCQAAFLLTLDRRHLLTPAAEAVGLLLEIMTPGDFLKRLAAGS